MIGVVSGRVIGVAFRVEVDMLVDADANRWVVTMAVVGCASTLTSSEEMLLFGWEACSCWTTTT